MRCSHVWTAVLFLWLSLAFSSSAGAQATQRQFEVVTIDFPGAVGTASSAINDQGDIVRLYATGNVSPNDRHGFLLSNGIFTTIDFPGALGTDADGINSRGVIVGTYFDAAIKEHGFALSNGVFHSIDFPGAVNTLGTGINNLGDIVGAYEDPAHLQTHGFLLSHGSFTSLDFPGAFLTVARGINDKGVIVGFYSDQEGNLHGFVFSKGVFRSFELPGGTRTTLVGINSAGALIGSAIVDGIEREFLLQNGVIKFIAFPGHATVVNGVNASDGIVGNYFDGESHGFFAAPR